MVLIILAVMVLVSLGLIVAGLHVGRDARKTLGWPQVEGRITESRVERDISHATTPLYYSRVRYTYRVNGQEHVGTRLRFTDYGVNVPAQAQARISCYAPGASVRVFHHPHDPREAVLEHAGMWLPFLLIVGGLSLVLCGLLAGVLGYLIGGP